MRARLSVFILLGLLVSAARTSAQTSQPAEPTIAISPSAGDVYTVHELQLQSLAPNAEVSIVLFDPSGGQTVMHVSADAAGAAQLPLTPTGGAWQVGIYRAVVAWDGADAISATFVAGDGSRHLTVGPDLPSPNSAVQVSGIGLPPNTQIHLVLTVAGGLGVRDVSAGTDAQGTLLTFLFPQVLGFDFFSAGRYDLAAPDLGLDVPFYIREHPSTSFITLPGTIEPDNSIPIQLNAYTPGRYIWAVYATDTGQVAGEFLFGPVDERGAVTTVVRFAPLPPGRYLLATPYDWGETTFDVPEPTPTATQTPMPTSTATATPTATPRPTATRTPRPTATRTPRPTATRTPVRKPVVKGRKTCKRTKNHKRRCSV